MFHQMLVVYLDSFLSTLLNLKSCNLSLREQEDVRSAKGEDEITLYNTKKRRIIYSSCRVGTIRNLLGGISVSLKSLRLCCP